MRGDIEERRFRVESSDFGGRRREFEEEEVVDFVFLFCVLIEVSYFLMIMIMSFIMMCE